MPLCDEMCNKCGTTDGVCMVMNLCDKCKQDGVTMNDMPKEIWACDAHVTINNTDDRIGLFTSINPTSGKSTKYIRADLDSQKQQEMIDKEVCLSDSGNNALENRELKAKNHIRNITKMVDALYALNLIDEYCDKNVAGMKFCEERETIRAALESKQEPVDVEGLKQDNALTDEKVLLSAYEVRIYDTGYNQAIDDLNAQGYLTQSAEKARDWLDKTACMKDAALVCKLTEQSAEKDAALLVLLHNIDSDICEALDYFDDRADISDIDGETGQASPNEESQLMQTLTNTRGQIKTHAEELQALKSGEWVLAPKKPTGRMIREGMVALIGNKGFKEENVYKAMLAARPNVEENNDGR